MTLPPGHTLDNVVGELQYMVSRYQCLRTRLRLGLPQQEVFCSGVLTLEVAEAGLSDPDTIASRP